MLFEIVKAEPNKKIVIPSPYGTPVRIDDYPNFHPCLETAAEADAVRDLPKGTVVSQVEVRGGVAEIYPLGEENITGDVAVYRIFELNLSLQQLLASGEPSGPIAYDNYQIKGSGEIVITTTPSRLINRATVYDRQRVAGSIMLETDNLGRKVPFARFLETQPHKSVSFHELLRSGVFQDRPIRTSPSHFELPPFGEDSELMEILRGYKLNRIINIPNKPKLPNS